MMNWYNGFDTLNDKEYNDLMEEMEMNNLQDELAAKNAADYFENELELDGAGALSPSFYLLNVCKKESRARNLQTLNLTSRPSHGIIKSRKRKGDQNNEDAECHR